MNLFQLGNLQLASGIESSYKIECDVLTDDDWTCLAYLLSQKLPPFGEVEGVPRGGLKLAEKMKKYRSFATTPLLPLLIVDDVSTTGGSIEKVRGDRRAIGGTIFARGVLPSWITPLFRMT